MVARTGFDRHDTGGAARRTPCPSQDRRGHPAAGREDLPWWEYRARFLTDERIDAGVTVLARAPRALERIGRRRGVARGIPGRHHRRRDLLRPHHRPLPGARCAGHAGLRLSAAQAHSSARELEQFLMLAREERLDPRAPLGSYAGAMGVAAVHAVQLPALRRGRRRRWPARPVARLARRLRQRRQLLARSTAGAPDSPVLADATRSGLLTDDARPAQR